MDGGSNQPTPVSYGDEDYKNVCRFLAKKGRMMTASFSSRSDATGRTRTSHYSTRKKQWWKQQVSLPAAGSSTTVLLLASIVFCCSLFAGVSSFQMPSWTSFHYYNHNSVNPATSSCSRGIGGNIIMRIRKHDLTTFQSNTILKGSTKNDDDKNNDDDDNNVDDLLFKSSLAKRIEEIQAKEQEQAESIAQGLSNRVLEIKESEKMENKIQSQSKIKLPVISFDALLPNQSLEGRTEDPTFCRFLRDTGLGGWFIMTSLSPKTRKIRRHGVIAKIDAVDCIASAGSSSTTAITSKDYIPTAVDFCIVGHRRCRIVGPRTDMEQRIGRWRRAYDPDCEESVLGWGPERFVDAPDELTNMLIEEEEEEADFGGDDNKKLPSTEWSSSLVECDLENVDAESDRTIVKEDETIRRKYESLIPMVEEWYELASNVDTYNNINVTASTRIRKGQPGLYVDPKAILKQVRNGLGPPPEGENDVTAFCFWAAALINPLPVLGASLEIRGQLLEAPTLKQRLQVLEWGLIRSIANLKGERPI